MVALFIGDLHCSQSNLEDTGEIFKLIDETLSKDASIELVCFLGDIFHTHSVVHQGPAFFVRRWIEKLTKKYNTLSWVALAGNHDFSTPNASVSDNAVRLVLGNLLTVVDDYKGTPCALSIGDFTFMPFMGDNDEFIRVCNMIDENTIPVCHQTFDGSKYENNHTAPGGVSQNKIPQKFVISGHIHMHQVLINEHNIVWYPGTPRALTAAEVNQGKFLWIFDSKTTDRTPISTGPRVKEYKAFYFYQGATEIVAAKDGEPRPWKQKDDVRLYVEGSEEFYEQVLAANKHLEGEVRFVPNIKKEMSRTLDIESAGSSVDDALHQYVHGVYNMSDDLRDSVWQKLQTWMPNLGAKI